MKPETKQFIKERWLDFRWGEGYAQAAIAAINLVVLLGVYFRLTTDQLWFLGGLLALPVVGLSIAIGNLIHRKFQLKVDNISGNQHMIDEIVERTVRRLKEERLQ